LFLDRRIYPDTSPPVLALIQPADESWQDKTCLQILLFIWKADKQHCRTYYHKAAKVTELPSGKNLARVAIDEYIGKVYAIERHIKELREEREKSGATLPLDTVLKIRQERSAPVMAAFKEWVEKLLPGVPPTSALGKALSYTMNQWPKLVRFLDHPE